MEIHATQSPDIEQAMDIEQAPDIEQARMMIDGNTDIEQAQAREVLTGENPALKTASQVVRNGFIRKVYGLLSAQLLLTVAIAAPFQMMSDQWLQAHSWLLYLSMFTSIAMICVMSCCQKVTRSYPTNYFLLFGFTAFEGVLIGFVSAQYTAGSVALCAGITALIFLGLTAYAWRTKRDFTGFGPYLFGALLSLLVFSFVIVILGLMGVPLKLLHMVYDFLGILIFVFYIIFDTQLIIGENGGHKHEHGIDDYVFAALNLYLDIINLFLHILSLLGDRSS